MAEEVEVFLEIGVGVGVVRAEAVAGEVGLGGGVEGGGEGIGPGVNALSLGIPPNVVMKWTGHSDYSSMKPYIDIVDDIKATSMTKFNGLLEKND